MSPFEEGDRVVRVVIPIVRNLAKKGSVTKVTWSNDNGYSEHIWVRWDSARDTEEMLTITGGQDYPVRKLDPVEALSDLAPKEE